MMTPFGTQMELPQFPQVSPFPMAQPPFDMGFGQDMSTMPQLPFMPFGPQADDAQPTMPWLPFMPFGAEDDDEQEAMSPFPFLPFPMPFSAQELPEIQTPFGTLPQPYELYEQMLKGAIEFLNNLLAQSENARKADDLEEDSSSDESEQDESADSASAAPAPGPKPQKGPDGGLISTNAPFGALLGALFNASDTDYFYED